MKTWSAYPNIYLPLKLWIPTITLTLTTTINCNSKGMVKI